MAPLIAIIGKPSAGKSTILNGLTDVNAKMGDYPFTTIEPNLGVAHVKVNCPCKGLNVTCEPNYGYCEEGIRYIPIELLDVAGLVPGASEGKGMGNQFLDDIRRAEGLIHVIDLSGVTDELGNRAVNYNPINDVDWLHQELHNWLYQLTFKDWKRTTRKLESDRTKVKQFFIEKLSGLGINSSKISAILQSNQLFLSTLPSDWDETVKDSFINNLFSIAFPVVICANKIDSKNGVSNFNKLKQQYNYKIIPTSGLAELMLQQASKSNRIKYLAGTSTIKILDTNSKDIEMIKAIQTRIINNYGSTGVYECLEQLIFEELKYIAVYPIEDQNHFTDSKGKVLPDVHLIPKNTTTKKFAGKIHSDFEKYFLHGILAPSGRKVSGSFELQGGEIVKIISSAK